MSQSTWQLWITTIEKHVLSKNEVGIQGWIIHMTLSCSIYCFYGFSVYNILHSPKIPKTSPANSCLPNLYPSSSSPGPQGPVRQRLSCNIQGGGVCDGENQPMESMAMNLWAALSESIQLSIIVCLHLNIRVPEGIRWNHGRNKEGHEPFSGTREPTQK